MTITPEELAKELVTRVNKAKKYDDELWTIINSISAGIATYEENGMIFIRDNKGSPVSDYRCFRGELYETFGVEVPKKGFKTFLRKTKTCLRKLVKEELKKEADFEEALNKVQFYDSLGFVFTGIYEMAYCFYRLDLSYNWENGTRRFAKRFKNNIAIKN